MLECRRNVRIGWGGLEIHELKFEVIFFINESLVDKENSSWGIKVQNQMFMDSIWFHTNLAWNEKMPFLFYPFTILEIYHLQYHFEPDRIFFSKETMTRITPHTGGK
jgi:hypothetical protein